MDRGIAWYLAQTKPVRQRNMAELMKHLRLPADARPYLVHVVEENETLAMRSLRQFVVGRVRAM